MSPASSRRVYLAAGPALLGDLARGHPAPRHTPAFAVTARTRSAAAGLGLDEEDLEYDALQAAEDHLRAAAVFPVVVSVDVPATLADDPDGDPEGGGDGPGGDPGGARVTLRQPVLASWVVCVHAAEPGAPEEEELLWFDVTEIPDLLARLAP